MDSSQPMDLKISHNWCGSNGSVPEPLVQQYGGSAAHNTAEITKELICWRFEEDRVSESQVNQVLNDELSQIIEVSLPS
ncbi:hypothetical protein EV2_039410 [Malus domestica]